MMIFQGLKEALMNYSGEVIAFLIVSEPIAVEVAPDAGKIGGHVLMIANAIAIRIPPFGGILGIAVIGIGRTVAVGIHERWRIIIDADQAMMVGPVVAVQGTDFLKVDGPIVAPHLIDDPAKRGRADDDGKITRPEAGEGREGN